MIIRHKLHKHKDNKDFAELQACGAVAETRGEQKKRRQ